MLWIHVRIVSQAPQLFFNAEMKEITQSLFFFVVVVLLCLELMLSKIPKKTIGITCQFL